MAKVYEVHGANSMAGLMTAVATCFHDHIGSALGFFPLYYLYGPAATGKTALAAALQRLTCDQSMTREYCTQMKAGHALRSFAEGGNELVLLDEYSATPSDHLQQVLKHVYDLTGYQRASLEASQVIVLPIRCSAIVTGNCYPSNNEALLTRFIVDEMQVPDSATRQAYIELHEMRYSAACSVKAEVTQHRQLFEYSFLTQYRLAQTMLHNSIDENKAVPDRLVNNHGVLLATYRSLRDKLAWPFTERQLVERLLQLLNAQREKLHEVQLANLLKP